MKKISVFLDDRPNNCRKLVEAEIVAEYEKTVRVRLPDGNVIVRKKARDLPGKEQLV